MKFNPDISAEKILSIPDDEPGMLFSSAATLKDEYRSLAKTWHPDAGKARADEVFPKVGILYAKAQLWVEAGIWEVPFELLLKTSDGKTFNLKYRRKRAIDVGTMYYGPTVVAFVVESKHSALFDNGVKFIKGLKYADSKMEKEVSRSMPKIKANLKLADGRRVLVLEKTSDVFLLRDLLEHQGGKLDPKHVAWVTSRVLGHTCYFKWAGISHNSMTLDTLFVTPKFHGICVYGGWWFAKNIGDELKIVPKPIHDIIPASVLNTKVASDKTDRIAARAIGREVAGDKTGIKLKKLGVPDHIEGFLRAPLGDDPFQDFVEWNRTLVDAFGPRRFTELNIKEEDIYDQKA